MNIVEARVASHRLNANFFVLFTPTCPTHTQRTASFRPCILDYAMNTPRLRSAGAWPSTPRTGQDAPTPNASASGRRVGISPLPNAPALSKASDDAPAPIIPFTVVDAPSQRLYVSFFYIGLTVWRLCDYLSLVTDETDSLWLFMKWVAIDSIFLYGLPGLKIPWLEWSSSTMTALFILHAFMNALLMFRIPVSS